VKQRKGHDLAQELVLADSSRRSGLECAAALTWDSAGALDLGKASPIRWLSLQPKSLFDASTWLCSAGHWSRSKSTWCLHQAPDFAHSCTTVCFFAQTGRDPQIPSRDRWPATRLVASTVLSEPTVVRWSWLLRCVLRARQAEAGHRGVAVVAGQQTWQEGQRAVNQVSFHVTCLEYTGLPWVAKHSACLFPSSTSP
jgi:hypothetical protein